MSDQIYQSTTRIGAESVVTLEFPDKPYQLLLGDCRERLKDIPTNTVDAVVTDPPYELGFMGKSWDASGIAYSVEMWKEVLRVMKPGAHILAFSGTRTYHRMVVAMEDAGFEIRDQLQWIYGSGFPKSLDVSKAIDKCFGKSRRVTGLAKGHVDSGGVHDDDNYEWKPTYERRDEPESAAAKQWKGWGTALKPAHEDFVVACKPLTGAPLRISLALELCQSKLFVSAARKFFALSPSGLIEGSNIAQWIAGQSTLTPGDLLDLTDTLPFESETTSNLSTELLWLGTLAEISNAPSTFTTEMESSLITDLRILKSLLLPITQESTLQNDGHGEMWNASLVGSLFSALAQKLNFIRTRSVAGPAINADAPLNLHPNSEPIVLARKPLEKDSVAKNVLKWGTGGINVDAGRIDAVDQKELEKNWDRKSPAGFGNGLLDGGLQTDGFSQYKATGRFPANVLFDEGAARMLDEQSGDRPSSGRHGNSGSGKKTGLFGNGSIRQETYFDSGGASRFFYTAKTSKWERNYGLDGMPKKRGGAEQYDSRWKEGTGENRMPMNQNSHPTVKPFTLMRYLVNLITPPGGVVLDPFLGSGTTGAVSVACGFKFIGIEMTPEYMEIAKGRIGSVKLNQVID